MSKRLTAALFALLVFAPALAVVAADPAAAHTKTVQRCSYDPFAGRQCWNEAVPHTHPKPTPPASCPAGMTGTPPSCYPIPNGSGSRTTPEDTTPEDTTPEDTTPEDTTPEDTTPEDTTPEDTTPEDTTPEDTTPEDTTPEDTTPDSSSTPDGSTNKPTNTDPCQAWVDATAEALHNSLPVTPAPQACRNGSNPVATLWAAVKSALTYLGKSEAERSEAERRQIEALIQSAEDAAEEGMRKALRAAGRFDDAKKLTGDALLETWDSLTPKQKSIAIGTACGALGLGVAAVGTAAGAPIAGGGGGAVAAGWCDVELSEADRLRLVRQGQERAQRTPDSTPDATPDSTPEGPPRPPEGPPKPDATTPTPQEAWNDAQGKFIRGEIDLDGLRAAAAKFQCSQGVQSKCK